MATNPPDYPCFVCGGALEWRMVETRRSPGGLLFGPTEYEQLPHTCPPETVEKWFAEALERGKKDAGKPFFTHLAVSRQDQA